jgi:hypothetical protein
MGKETDIRYRHTVMKYPVTRFKPLTLGLKELEQFVRRPEHLATGRPLKLFGDMRPREVLANWLLCAVINSTEETERVTFSSDPIGGDGVLHDDASGFSFPTEHVYVRQIGDAAAGKIEDLLLEQIEQKCAKGGEAYASGKTLVVFLDSGGGPWYPNKVARRLPDPLHFNAVWIVGLQDVVEGEYIYVATRVDKMSTGTTPKWRVRIAPDFGSWTVEPIQAA